MCFTWGIVIGDSKCYLVIPESLKEAKRNSINNQNVVIYEIIDRRTASRRQPHYTVLMYVFYMGIVIGDKNATSLLKIITNETLTSH